MSGHTVHSPPNLDPAPTPEHDGKAKRDKNTIFWTYMREKPVKRLEILSLSQRATSSQLSQLELDVYF